ncbi:MAG: transposase [Granulosicoccus sp.]
MARANRHFIAGQIWHITQRCHQQQFLLRFDVDRRRWLYWLFQARKRYGLSVLNYVVTSNHIHLLVRDCGNDAIPNSMQLIAGRSAQEFNRRLDRRGAFWEDRYHATAIQSSVHLARCLVYIDLNMVRAGVVDHPELWTSGGYYESLNPRRRGGRIDHEGLRNLLGVKSTEQLQLIRKAWIDVRLQGLSLEREPVWTESLAVGSLAYAQKMQKALGASFRSRLTRAEDVGYSLRELGESYGIRHHLDLGKRRSR